MDRAYIEQMRAHVDEGGALSHRNGVDLLAEVERQNTALDSLAARVKELEDHNRRLGQGSAERYWEDRYRDEAAALARAKQQRDEAYERAAKEARQIAINAERRAANHNPQSRAEEAALNKAQGAFDAEAAIRRLASGPEGGSALTAASDGEVG